MIMMFGEGIGDLLCAVILFKIPLAASQFPRQFVGHTVECLYADGYDLIIR